MKNRFVIFTLLLSTISFGQDSYIYSQPKELNDGWKTNSLKAQNVDTTLIYKMFSHLKSKENKLHSVLLIKNNELIIEEYFKEYSADKQHDLRSVTKSIRAILMGIAIDKGFIESLDDPISKYLKTHKPTKNLDARKDKITIKHLLTMSTGWDCNDWDKKSIGQEDKVSKKKDWIQYTLNLPMINDVETVLFGPVKNNPTSLNCKKPSYW